MPKMGGREAYEEIKKMRPDVKVLFMSGYTDDRIRQERLLEGGADFILKPVSPRDLLRKVRELLDR
jgi:CheY-like chemotaxis protein